MDVLRLLLYYYYYFLFEAYKKSTPDVSGAVLSSLDERLWRLRAGILCLQTAGWFLETIRQEGFNYCRDGFIRGFHISIRFCSFGNNEYRCVSDNMLYKKPHHVQLVLRRGSVMFSRRLCRKQKSCVELQEINRPLANPFSAS